MSTNQNKKELEAEKLQLAAFLKVAEKFGLSPEETEKQVNFYLERIAQLMKALNNQARPK